MLGKSSWTQSDCRGSGRSWCISWTSGGQCSLSRTVWDDFFPANSFSAGRIYFTKVRWYRGPLMYSIRSISVPYLSTDTVVSSTSPTTSFWPCNINWKFLCSSTLIYMGLLRTELWVTIAALLVTNICLHFCHWMFINTLHATVSVAVGWMGTL